MSTPFEAHKDPRLTSAWVPILQGEVTAAGAPSKSRLSRWPGRGVTDIVTLQRADEMQPWLPETCAELGLAWHGYPLSGRRLSAPADSLTLNRFGELVELLRSSPPRRLVFHCAAGMHRTGLALYLLMRHASLSPEQALAAIERARPITADELRRKTRKAPPLLESAEAIYARQVE